MKTQQTFRKRPFRIRGSRLSARLAGAAAFFSFLAFLGVYLMTLSMPAFLLILGPLGVGAGTYFVAFQLLVPRLRLGHSTLKQVRKHQFENLETANLTGGDELNALIRQVYRAGLAMEKELLSLRKMEDYRREFLGNVSHELKTPIFTIQGFAETLLEGAIDDDAVNRKFLEKILTNTHRLTNLASDLVEISRIETGELEMRMAPLDLEHLVDEVLEHLEQVAQEKGVMIKKQIEGRLPRILGDRARLSQVFVNLIDNAIKYSNNGGAVEVVCHAVPSGSVRVAVIDNGIGIEPQHIPRLTERFYRVDKSRSRGQGGTGLGLAIVKHILGAHESEMKVRSKLGKGSTFEFELESTS